MIMNRNNIQTLYDLMAATASHLAGKYVRVRLQKPATKGMAGECHRDELGRLVIDINPQIHDNDRFIYVLLHEIAHAKHHQFKRSTVNKAGAGTLAPLPVTRSYQAHEDQADTQAADWIAYAKKHAKPYFDVENALWALLDYEE